MLRRQLRSTSVLPFPPPFSFIFPHHSRKDRFLVTRFGRGGRERGRRRLLLFSSSLHPCNLAVGRTDSLRTPLPSFPFPVSFSLSLFLPCCGRVAGWLVWCLVPFHSSSFPAICQASLLLLILSPFPATLPFHSLSLLICLLRFMEKEKRDYLPSHRLSLSFPETDIPSPPYPSFLCSSFRSSCRRRLLLLWKRPGAPL